MNMNKKIIFIIINLLLCITFINVYAEENCDKYACATCAYKYEHNTFYFNLTADGKGSVDLKVTSNDKYKSITHEFLGKNFVIEAELKLHCPDQLFVKPLKVGGDTQGYFIDANKKNNEYIATPLVSNESTNNNLFVVENAENYVEPYKYTFPVNDSYKMVTVNIAVENDQLKVWSDPSDYEITLDSSITVSDFSNKACVGLSGSCVEVIGGPNGYTRRCSIGKDPNAFGGLQECVKDGEIEFGEDESELEYQTTLDPTIVGEGFCEEDSTKKALSLVGIILMIAKVLVPLIIIVIGSIDLFKAIMSKDEKDLMKSIKSIGLRLLVGVFIFFVPTIVDVVIDLVRDGHNENQCVECVLNPLNCR